MFYIFVSKCALCFCQTIKHGKSGKCFFFYHVMLVFQFKKPDKYEAARDVDYLILENNGRNSRQFFFEGGIWHCPEIVLSDVMLFSILPKFTSKLSLVTSTLLSDAAAPPSVFSY